MKAIEKEKVTVYHNPKCSTSRNALSILKKKKIKFDLVYYLVDTPTKAEFKKLLAKLHLKPRDVVRTKEKLFKERLEGLEMNDDEWIKIILDQPVLLERPIIVKGNKAIIARPLESIDEFFKK